MANLGLGSRWRCLMANDFSDKKARAYRLNFPPANEFILNDVSNLTTHDLPEGAVLAWASFPCQDLSLAGNWRGLQGDRSGSYWGFWRLMHELELEGRPPSIITLENVVGTITANQGIDFQVLLQSLIDIGYRVGTLVIDAVHFVPQSRPRLFVIAVRNDQLIPNDLTLRHPNDLWHPMSLRKAHARLGADLKDSWVWWDLPYPQCNKQKFIDLLEMNPISVAWHSDAETARLLQLMAPLHLEKVQAAQKVQRPVVGTIYRRVRSGSDGQKSQRAEIRFDGISGCLRTGSGGSSRQFIMLVDGDKIRSRLLSTREAARLMGLPDDYVLPSGYNEAYHLVGDGLVVPVVSWLEQHILSPLAFHNHLLESKSELSLAES